MNDLKDIAEITLKHFGVDITVTEQYKRVEKKLNELERLQEKATPMAIIENDDYVGTCPNCEWNLEWAENIRRDYSYCPNCGQRLTWEEKK